jgi:hypothetical protein
MLKSDKGLGFAYFVDRASTPLVTSKDKCPKPVLLSLGFKVWLKNKDIMKKTKTLFLLSLLVIACKQNQNSSLGDTSQPNPTIESSQSIDLDKRYLGTWKLVGLEPTPRKDDHSMDGILCTMEKLPNSEKSFVFHLYTGHELILSSVDNNNLHGENAGINLKYDETTQQLYMTLPSGSTQTYKKL